jgi:high-affinity iron transporter
MLASSIVLFRELFEIVLIVGIVLAATRSLHGRKKWIIAGISMGIFGAAMIAVFANAISDFAEGVGQEVFNATVLLIASIFIGWTVIWMSQHGRHIKTQFTELGNRIQEGNATFISLSIIIALAIWREGSEIVLFTYGMLASGQSLADIGLGALIGGLLGMSIGFATYKGLISLPYKYYLRATSVLLILLVAGMISQSVQLFIAAGWINELTQRAWDTSWLIPDHSILAQTLHALIGYTAKPAIIQAILYFSTVGAFYSYIQYKSIKHSSKKVSTMQLPATSSSTKALMIVATALVTLPNAGFAGSKVYSPYVEKGEFEIEWKGALDVDDDSQVSGAMKNQMAVGYGFTDYWYTEVIGELERDGSSGADQKFTALEWENRFQITQPNEYWLDVGAYAAYENARESRHADKVELGLLLAKDTGKFTHYANIFLEKEVGAYTTESVESSFAWSTRYRYKEWLEPGFEVHSEFGEIKENKGYDEQEHLVGPALYGKVHNFKYDIAYLFGASDAAADGQLKWVLEYEVKL